MSYNNILKELSVDSMNYIKEQKDWEYLVCCENLPTDLPDLFNVSNYTPSNRVEISPKIDHQFQLKNLLSFERKFAETDCRYVEDLCSSWERQFPNKSFNLEKRMREVVFSWMHEVCSVEACEEEIFYLSCSYLDRLVRHESHQVNKSNLQKFAAVCMLISSKLKHALPLTISLLSEYTDCSVSPQDIQDCEVKVLEMLDWNICMATPHSFLDPLLFASSFSEDNCTQIRQHAVTFIDLSTYYLEFSDIQPSVLACTCLLSSIMGLKSTIAYEKALMYFCSLVPFDAELLLQCQNVLEHRFKRRAAGNQSAENQHPTSSEQPFNGFIKDLDKSSQDEQDGFLTPKNSFKFQVASCTPPSVVDIMLDHDYHRAVVET